MKTCTGCHLDKPLDDFSPKKGGAFGRQAKCKLCRNDERKAARKADPERIRAIDRRADAKRGLSTPRVRKWRTDHPDEHRQRSRQDRAQRRAAQLLATTGPVDFAALQAAFQGCYLCGQLLAGDVHMDHVIPLSRGGAHCMANLRPTHEACNLRKADKLLAELHWYVGPVDMGAALCHDGATPTDEGTTP